MVAFASIITASAVILTASASGSVSPVDLKVGEYFRPGGELVSGSLLASALFRRSPCPGLNTLANHGYLPRDGKNLTKAMVSHAVLDQFNLDVESSMIALARIPEPFDLSLLSTHGLIEHDASLVHADSYFGFDPAEVNQELVDDVWSRGDGRIFTVVDLGALRRDRFAACAAVNPTCTISTRDTTNAFGESALILNVLGGNKNETITSSHLWSFLVDERFPVDFVKSETLVTMAQLQTTAGRVAVAARVPKP